MGQFERGDKMKKVITQYYCDACDEPVDHVYEIKVGLANYDICEDCYDTIKKILKEKMHDSRRSRKNS